IFTFVLVYIARSNLKAFLDELKQNTELRRADLIHSINANLSTYRRLRQWLIKEKNPDPKSHTVEVNAKIAEIRESFLQNGLSEVDFSWAGRGEPGCVRSGRGGPVVDDANDLIDGERDDAEHEMAFDLERAADAEKSGAELVFQTGVDAFGHGAEIVDQVVEVGHVDELQALDLAAPFGLAFVVGAKVALDDGGVAERPALVVDRGGVVGGVHEIVEIGDAGARHGHQGNGDLAVVDGGRGQHAGDRDLAAGHVDVEFVPGPGLFVALAVFLAADVAGGGQVGEHLAEVLHDLPLETRRLRLRPLFVLAWTSALARRRGMIGRRGDRLCRRWPCCGPASRALRSRWRRARSPR